MTSYIKTVYKKNKELLISNNITEGSLWTKKKVPNVLDPEFTNLKESERQFKRLPILVRIVTIHPKYGWLITDGIPTTPQEVQTFLDLYKKVSKNDHK